jgi:adenosylcobinamide kinase/adenosylcobinamide-phosphate guanylyltransferase
MSSPSPQVTNNYPISQPNATVALSNASHELSVTTHARVKHEFVLGGQKSGKSRRAEFLASEWLAADPQHQAVLIATAMAHDSEMQKRIQRHQDDRALNSPGLATLEEPWQLAKIIENNSHPNTLLVVDCLTLWLTNYLMPMPGFEDQSPNYLEQLDALEQAIKNASGPIVLVSNEIGLGVIPMGKEVRQFVDALGILNQKVAHICQKVTLMAAGIALTMKDQ